MARRTVYGNEWSESGWPMVDEGSCQWITVPGTNPTVSLEIQNGQPLQILRAWAADIHAYVQPLRDADSACWTATNSVGTSNHLSGTALDLDWDDHPMGNEYAGWNQQQINTIRELLDFYEGTVFWGNDWDSPKDSMHFQMGYNTYGNPHTADFITRKIRADGFSTFRRGTQPAPPPPVLSRSDGYAVLIIEEGRRRGITPRGITIALATGLVESNIKVYANERVPESMSIPHDAVGSDAYSVGIFQQQVRDTGNGWWWGDAQTCMDPTTSAGLFYDRLARLDYNGPNSPGSYAQAVQSSAYPDRYDERFQEATDLYNRLSNTASTGEDDLSAQAEQFIAEIHGALFNEVASRSIYATPGEGPRWQIQELIANDDGMIHQSYVETSARLGDPDALQRVALVAAGRGVATDADTVARARRVLADIEAANPDVLKSYLAQNGAK